MPKVRAPNVSTRRVLTSEFFSYRIEERSEGSLRAMEDTSLLATPMSRIPDREGTPIPRGFRMRRGGHEKI